MMELDFRDIRKPPLQLAILFATLLLFLIANSVLRDGPLNFLPTLIAIAIVFEIFIFVGMEVKDGAKKHGWKHEVVDTVVALAVAIAIWYGLSFVLNTSTPVSGVVSCSMLPNLQRGDFVIVQGAPVNAYEIEMTKTELEALSGPSLVTFGSNNATIEGSLFPYCINNKNSDMCRFFISNPEAFMEKKGPFTYKYERCSLVFSSGSTASEPCVKSVTFKGTEYLANFSNDIIVYQPVAGDYYSLIGDIVHRAMFKINVEEKTYYLARGDNNPILDIQAYDYARVLENTPVPQDNIRGKVIFRIPLLGYFKLFISGYLKEDPQCKTQLDFTNV
jgi:signal peptidase I